jgi:cytochrome c biogenesis protein CcmG, thiol:disulfide interchange protein DsbE
MRWLAPVAVLLLVLSGCALSKQGGAAAVSELPEATLQPFGGQGQPVDLADLRGPMVINLWASWCVPCATELPYYEAFAQKYAGKVDVLGVDWQDTRLDKARALIRKTGVTYPLVTDPEGRLHNKYLPKLILLDEHGKVAYEKYVQITSLDQIESLVEKHLEVSAS